MKPQSLCRLTPGGARIGNGELSGQMQYRGLFGERLNLRVDGQNFASGGPNLMDPVYHYAPAPLVSSVVIDRGVSPVSKGPGLGGGADAASDQWRFNVLGAYEEGGDTEFGDGVIGGTAFERAVYGLSAGVKTNAGEFTLDLRRQNTDPTGNPPFPMDIQYFDTDFARVGYDNDFGEIRLSANINYRICLWVWTVKRPSMTSPLPIPIMRLSLSRHFQTSLCPGLEGLENGMAAWVD